MYVMYVYIYISIIIRVSKGAEQTEETLKRWVFCGLMYFGCRNKNNNVIKPYFNFK